MSSVDNNVESYCSQSTFDIGSSIDAISSNLLVGLSENSSDDYTFAYYNSDLVLENIDIYSVVPGLHLANVISLLRTKYLFSPFNKKLVIEIVHEMKKYFEKILINYNVICGYAIKVKQEFSEYDSNYAVRLVFLVDGAVARRCF